MIPVELAPEPPLFDKNVRKKGRQWLKKKKIAFDKAPSKKTKLHPFWQNCTKDIWRAYSGVCAYFAIYFDLVTGAASTEHFIAKSKHAGNAYEWNNYRLACLGANRNKNKYDDVLDPVGLRNETFYINFSDGSIFPNPSLPQEELELATATIKRLHLDNSDMRKVRTDHFVYCRDGQWSRDFLSRQSPFVYYEMQRQGLL